MKKKKQKNQVNLENSNFNITKELQKQAVQKVGNLQKRERTFQTLAEDL